MIPWLCPLPAWLKWQSQWQVAKEFKIVCTSAFLWQLQQHRQDVTVYENALRNLEIVRFPKMSVTSFSENAQSRDCAAHFRKPRFVQMESARNLEIEHVHENAFECNSSAAL